MYLYLKMMLSVLLIIGLAGCATARKGHVPKPQELQERVTLLEEALQAKDQEIYELKNKLDKTTTRRSKRVHLSHKDIQTALTNAGLYHGSIDGKIGKQTRQAIRAFQEANGLKADGIVGKRTAAKLNERLGK